MRHPTPLPRPAAAPLVTVALLLAAPALALQQTGPAEATFTGQGPAGFRVQGRTGALTLRERGPVVEVSVALGGLETGIALRDRHMKERYLEVHRYPDAVLEVPRAAVPLPAEGQASQGQARGRLSLHGRTREVDFRYTVRREGGTYRVEGALPLDLRDWGIDVPRYLGVTVKPGVETAVTFSFTE